MLFDYMRPIYKSIQIVALVGLCMFSATSFAESPLQQNNNGAYPRLQLRGIMFFGADAGSFGHLFDADTSTYAVSWRLPLYFMETTSNGPATPYAKEGVGFLTAEDGLGQYLGIASDEKQRFSTYLPAFRYRDSSGMREAQMGRLRYSLGYQTLVDDFSNAPVGAKRLYGAYGKAQSSSIGYTLSTADMRAPLNLFATRFFMGPLNFFSNESDTPYPDSLWEVAISYVRDNGNDIDRGHTVSGLGLETSLRLYDGSLFGLQGYYTYNRLKGIDAQDRWRAGHHIGAKMQFDMLPTMPLTLLYDYTSGEEGYTPRYFDTLYMLERGGSYGQDRPKDALVGAATRGHRLLLEAELFSFATLKADYYRANTKDAPTSDDKVQDSRLLLGAAAQLWKFGAAVSMGHTAFDDDFEGGFFGPGFVMTAEARLMLVYDIIHLVTQYYRVHEPTLGGASTTNGFVFGVEGRFGV